MISPTQRTLKELRNLGYECAITEKWNQYAKIRQDLFGFIDIVALSCDSIIGIQATTGANHAARKKKILQNPHFPSWKKAGGIVRIISWSKNSKKKWICRSEEL